MKKLLSIFTIIITLTLLFSSNLYATNATNENIENTITQYLSNSLEEQKELKVIANNYIVPNSDLYKYDKLKSKLLVKWYKGIGVKIRSYNINLKINSIKVEENLIRVDLDSTIKFRYDNVDFDSGYTDNHIIYLTTAGDKLLVEKDIFEMDKKAEEVEKNEIHNSLNHDGYKEYINNKIKLLEEREYTFEKDIERFKNPVKKETPLQATSLGNISLLSITYDSYAAASWALDHVYDQEDYPGADCTNFVSKALNHGGLPTDGTWYQGSNAWIRVIELRDWLVNKGYANQYSSYSYAQLGDVIQYKYASNGLFSHSVIVTGKDNWSSYPYVSAHTSARYNVLASIYYPDNPTFSGYRVLDVHGI
ncbi:MAG: amidase domain-containing protein [Bacteroidota bacterium]